MKSWPHAPSRAVREAGTYMVTSGTYEKKPFFAGPDRLAFLEESLLTLAADAGWKLEAWAVFPNHYHFVACSPDDDGDPRPFIGKLHGTTARWLNRLEGAEGRKIWHRCWPTRLTYERSYLARLNYVMQNPVRHGLVREAHDYPFCSAEWFRLRAEPSWYETVVGFPVDRVQVDDEF